MILAVAYMRCSGRGQIDGDTWERQETAILAYAAAHDLEITSWFRDEGLTGTLELQHRPGLAACLDRVENNGVHVVLVEIADRLARDSMIAELIIRQFQKAKCQVISASGGVDLTAGDATNPTAKLVRQVLAAVAEFDRCVTVLKLQAAKERIRSNGRREGARNYSPDPKLNKRIAGRFPYGSKLEEAQTLQIIRELADKGLDYQQIAAFLNEHAMPSRYGKPWHKATIHKILHRAA
jgi:DNA invertase Pin-like site-specific DNA recombinase